MFVEFSDLQFLGTVWTSVSHLRQLLVLGEHPAHGLPPSGHQALYVAASSDVRVIKRFSNLRFFQRWLSQKPSNSSCPSSPTPRSAMTARTKTLAKAWPESWNRVGKEASWWLRRLPEFRGTIPVTLRLIWGRTMMSLFSYKLFSLDCCCEVNSSTLKAELSFVRVTLSLDHSSR